MQGKARLAEATQSRQIQVEQARGEVEAAKMRAEAIAIVGQATKDFPEQLEAYMNGDHAYKITLIVDTVEELKQLQAAYKNKCATKLVTDKGFTVFKEPTTTCLGIGPIPEDMIGADLKALKTFC
jgi:peptidyl-tRNA hydrolase